MTQYIEKSALVAELERIEHETNYEPFTGEVLGKRCACKSLLSFIDTLDVKEVNLEEEVDKWYNNEAPKEFENILYRDIENFAKYFFELGLKVSNKAEKKEVEEEHYIMGETGKFTTTTKAQKGK